MIPPFSSFKERVEFTSDKRIIPKLLLKLDKLPTVLIDLHRRLVVEPVLSSNPWRFFYEFLHRSERSRWTEGVERDFGSVHGLPWEEWWEERKGLFELLEPWLLTELKTEEDFSQWHGDDVLTVTVNIEMPKAQLLKAFEQALDQRGRKRSGQPEYFGYTVSDYHLGSRPDCSVLSTYLEAWDRCLERTDAGPTLYDIGVAMKLHSHIVKKNKDSPHEAVAKRQAMAALVTRYRTRAQQIVTGIESGLFPAGQ